MPIESLNNDKIERFTWCSGCESVQRTNNIKHDKELKLIVCCNCRDIQLKKLGI